MGIGNTQKLAPAPASPRLLCLLETSSQEHMAAHPVLESVAGGTLFATPRQHYVVARTLARSGSSSHLTWRMAQSEGQSLCPPWG